MKNKRTRILITGASSWIGSSTAVFLAEKGYRVIGTVRNSKSIAAGSPGTDNLKYVIMDVCDPKSVTMGVSEAVGYFGGLMF